MPIGIAGDSVFLIDGLPAPSYDTIELRTITNVLQSLLGNGGQAVDELNVIRNDQAFELGIPTPIPGTNS